MSSVPLLLVSYVLTAKVLKDNAAGLELQFEDAAGNLGGNFLSMILSCQWVMSESETGTDLNRETLFSDNVDLLMHLLCLTTGERCYCQWNNNLWKHNPGKLLPTI